MGAWTKQSHTGAGEIKPSRLFLEKAKVFDGRTKRAISHENLIGTYGFSQQKKGTLKNPRSVNDREFSVL